MKCGSCNEGLPVDSESVTCCVCVKKFHFNCSVREAKWRNMLPENKSKWACVKCKQSSSLSRTNSTSSNLSEVGVPTVEDEVNTNTTLLLKINSRLNTLDEVKKSVDDISASLNFLSGKYDQLLEEVHNYREENKKLIKEVEQLKKETTVKDQELAALTSRFNSLEQYGRGINLEIHGIVESTYNDANYIVEKTAKALGLAYRSSEIQAAHRLPSRDKDKIPVLLVQFTNKAVKQQWLIAGRKKRLLSRDIVGEGEGRVYFNESLTPYYSKLFRETRMVAKEKHYDQVWVLNGTIRVKKQRDSRQTHIISNYEDLKKLA